MYLPDSRKIYILTVALFALEILILWAADYEKHQAFSTTVKSL